MTLVDEGRRAPKAVVLGVSPDDVQSHARFAARHERPLPLLADVPKDGTPPACAKYGVWQEKSMCGRRSTGVVRTTSLIDRAGKIARRRDEVKAPGHAEAVLEEIEQLMN